MDTEKTGCFGFLLLHFSLCGKDPRQGLRTKQTQHLTAAPTSPHVYAGAGIKVQLLCRACLNDAQANFARWFAARGHVRRCNAQSQTPTTYPFFDVDRSPKVVSEDSDSVLPVERNGPLQSEEC